MQTEKGAFQVRVEFCVLPGFLLCFLQRCEIRRHQPFAATFSPRGNGVSAYP